MVSLSAVKVLVINLPCAAQRRERMCARLDAAGLDYAFVPAVDGRGIDVAKHPAYDAPRRRRAFGRDLTGGELGCLLSHRAVYERMLAEGLETVLVLEDDAILGPDFPAVLEALLTLPLSYDLVRFIGSAKLARLRQRRLYRLPGGHWLSRLETTPGGAYAYLLRRSGAEKLLPAMQRNWLPVDSLMGRSWEHGLDWYVVQPAVTDHDRDVESLIGMERFDKARRLAGVERFLYPLTRGLHKIAEGFGKRVSYWSALPADRRLKKTL